MASDSPVPTLVATAGEHVLSRHLHVDVPVGADADPVRNGFHGPKCLWGQAPPDEPHSWTVGSASQRTTVDPADLLGGYSLPMLGRVLALKSVFKTRHQSTPNLYLHTQFISFLFVSILLIYLRGRA